MTGCLVSVVFLLLPSHLIPTASFIMLVLLLVLLDRATARAPLHEHLIGKRNEEFGTRHEEFGEDYGYIEADWNHENKASKHGADYGTDYGYVDAKHGADYAKEYEYKTSSEGFRSGTVDPEVGTFVSLNSASGPRFASVGSRMWKILLMQGGLLGVRKALPTTILGR